MFSVKIVI